MIFLSHANGSFHQILVKNAGETHRLDKSETSEVLDLAFVLRTDDLDFVLRLLMFVTYPIIKLPTKTNCIAQGNNKNANLTDLWTKTAMRLISENDNGERQ